MKCNRIWSLFLAFVMAAMVVSCRGVQPDGPDTGGDGPGDEEEPVDPDANSSASYESIIYLTAREDLNPVTREINSHREFIDRSIFSPIYGTYVTLARDVTFWDIPLYPRLVRCNDGTWLMSYHYGDAGATAGNQVMYLRSTDLIGWKPATGSGSTVPYLFEGGGSKPLYAGAYLLRLSDGRIMAAASYRKNDIPGGDYHYTNDDNGIAIKYSSDNGRTWTSEQRVNVGTNWEPFILETEGGQIQIYYTDCNHVKTGIWKGPAAYGGSGVGMIYSDDKGRTWRPGTQDHIHVIRQMLDYKGGYALYTDQMPTVVTLNGGKRLAAALESDMGAARGRSDYSISLAYSDGNGDWDMPDGDGDIPSDRRNAVFKGCAPHLVTFPSGETLLTYNTDRFCMRIGNETAREFGEEQPVFGAYGESKGYWGTACRISDHSFVACTGGSGNVLQIGQFYLNHAIKSSFDAPTVDGGNGDWSVNEALLLCSKGPVSASLRCAHNAAYMYFIVEVPDANLSSTDYFQVFLSPYSGQSLTEKTIRIKGNAEGLIETDVFRGDWKKTPCAVKYVARYEGSLNDSSDSDAGYIAEFSIPRKMLEVSDGRILINFALRDYDNSPTSDDCISPVSESTTARWMPVYGL